MVGLRERLSVWIPTPQMLVQEVIVAVLLVPILAILALAVGGLTGLLDGVHWKDLMPDSEKEWAIWVGAASLIVVLERIVATDRKIRRISENAQISAIGEPTVIEEPPNSETADNLPEPDEEDELAKGGTPEGYVSRFGMLWRPYYVPKRVAGFDVLKYFSVGWPEVLRIDGPYCPRDRERLQYKDNKGYRHISEDDDINWEGHPYCPKCGFDEHPDPNYKGGRPLRDYRKMVLNQFS